MAYTADHSFFFYCYIAILLYLLKRNKQRQNGHHLKRELIINDESENYVWQLSDYVGASCEFVHVSLDLFDEWIEHVYINVL